MPLPSPARVPHPPRLTGIFPPPEPIASLVPQISIHHVLETLTLVSESLTKETPNPLTRQVLRVSLLRRRISPVSLLVSFVIKNDSVEHRFIKTITEHNQCEYIGLQSRMTAHFLAL